MTRRPLTERLITPTGALRAWWAVLMVLIATFAVAAICIGFTIQTQRATERRLSEQQAVMEHRLRGAQVTSERQSCGLLDILDKPLQPGAPQRSVDILREIHAWRVRAGC